MSQNGLTVLHVAAGAGLAEGVQLLLENHADVNQLTGLVPFNLL